MASEEQKEGSKSAVGEQNGTNGAEKSTKQKRSEANGTAENNKKKESTEEDGKSATSSVPSKRKAKAPTEPSKVPRRSARSAPKPETSPVQILNFLLSPASIPFARPKDEQSEVSSDANLRTYSTSALTPFEELMSAVILSRPISHALGVRSIRTLLNPPYEYTTPKKIRAAGAEGRRKALDEARTQHRQKTADELGILADAVVEKLGDGEEDVSLERVRKECEEDVLKERDLLKSNIKGLGNTGLDIFFRRVQGQWPEAYPFMDARTTDAIRKLGLPASADELQSLLDDSWQDLEHEDIDGKDEDEKKRKVFVRLLERAVGADLEHNLDQLLTEAAKME
ncbi:hypothetical protein MMC25_000045 [Agyrium rufum]|nr:hypothetical protein [Agyrium rufum]